MEQRTAKRCDTEFAACCVSMGKSSQAHLLNISPNGCLIETSEPMLEAGKPMRLKIPGFSSLDGTVAWQDGNRGGIEFTVALHPAVVDYIVSIAVSETDDGPPIGTIAADGSRNPPGRTA